MAEDKTTIEKYNEITGREFQSEEDMLSHIKNLQDLAFSKKEEIRKELQSDFDTKIEQEKEKVRDETEDKFQKYRVFIRDANIDLDKVNPLAIKEYLGEQHSEIAPRAATEESISRKLNLEKKAKAGNEEAIHELVKEQFGYGA